MLYILHICMYILKMHMPHVIPKFVQNIFKMQYTEYVFYVFEIT